MSPTDNEHIEPIDPLAGLRILVTRPRHQLDSIVDRLETERAKILIQPAIAIEAPEDWQPVDRAIDRIEQFDWIVFSSANGVEFFIDRLQERHGDTRRLSDVRLAAIGPATADALRQRQLDTDLTPTEYRAESLADAIIDRTHADSYDAADSAPPVALLVRASRGREVLSQRLTSAGIKVEQVVAYTSRDVAQPEADIHRALIAGEIDWITITSSAIARSLIAMLGKDLRHARLAAISPITAKTLTDAGYQPAVVAEEYTVDGLIDAIRQSMESEEEQR